MPRWKSQPIPTTYVPDEPCKKCGTSLRYKKSWNCVECHKRRDRRVPSKTEQLTEALAKLKAIA